MRTLTDGVVTLRPARAPDAEAIAAACQDPEIPRWTTVPSPYTVRDALAHIAEPGAEEHLLIVDADDRLLGAIGCRVREARAEIGYWVAAEARGRGVATRALVLLRDAAGTPEVRVLVHEDNRASRRVAERAGFADTGQRVPGPRRADGRADHVVYAWRAPASA